jgi:hypothetical protein
VKSLCLWNFTHPRRRRLQLHCCETLKLLAQYICVGRLLYVVSKDMKKFKSRKPSSLVPCPCDAGTNLHFSLTTFDFYSCTSVIPVQYIHISSKNCNCLCHVILFINFYNFYKHQIICSGILYIALFVYFSL